jgi:hypothetical protein
MAADVVWQGLLPELACHGRDEVADVLGSAGGGRLPRVTRMEAEGAGDRVVVTVEGPDFGPGPVGTALEPIGGPRTLAFWFGDGRVRALESFATRQEALGVATDLSGAPGLCFGGMARTRPTWLRTSPAPCSSASHMPAISKL